MGTNGRTRGDVAAHAGEGASDTRGAIDSRPGTREAQLLSGQWGGEELSFRATPVFPPPGHQRSLKSFQGKGHLPGVATGSAQPSKVWKVFHNVISTPVVFMVPVGLLANVLFRHQLPTTFAAPFQTFGNSFAALSLFILGMSIADQAETAGADEARLGPIVEVLVLIAGKCILLPLAIALPLTVANVGSPLVMMGLVYGCLPCAPATYFFATEYGLCTEYIAMATVLGTFLFAPLVYVIAQLAFLVMNHQDQLMDQVEFAAWDMSIISLVCALWTLGALAAHSGRKRHLYGDHHHMGMDLICCIAIGWVAACAATLTCYADVGPELDFLRRLIGNAGRLSARIFTGTLALSEVFCCLIGSAAVKAKSPIIIGAGWSLTLLATTATLFHSEHPIEPAGTNLLTCWYPYTMQQFVVFTISISLSALSILASLGFLILTQYRGARALNQLATWRDIRLDWRVPTSVRILPTRHSSFSRGSPQIHGIPIPGALSIASSLPYAHSHPPPYRPPPHIAPEQAVFFGSDDDEELPQSESKPGQSGDGRSSNWQGLPPNGPPALGCLLGNPGLLPAAAPSLGLEPVAAIYHMDGDVSVRWRNRTDVDEQNWLLLYCAYSLLSMLVALCLCILALYSDGTMPKDSAVGGFLLLLDTVLSYGQGIVLFLAFGIHPGLVEPLVKLREWWVAYRSLVAADDDDVSGVQGWSDVLAGAGSTIDRQRLRRVQRRINSTTDLFSQPNWQHLMADDASQMGGTAGTGGPDSPRGSYQGDVIRGITDSGMSGGRYADGATPESFSMYGGSYGNSHAQSHSWPPAPQPTAGEESLEDESVVDILEDFMLPDWGLTPTNRASSSGVQIAPSGDPGVEPSWLRPGNS